MEKRAMTQEELDALMSEDLEIDEEIATEEAPKEESSDTLKSEETVEEETESSNLPDDEQQEEHFRVDATSSWPPPPPTEDHQVVNQLDGVTKDSEIKATEVFDKLENINNMTMNIENAATEQLKLLENNIDIFERLSTKFSNIESFKVALEENKIASSQRPKRCPFSSATPYTDVASFSFGSLQRSLL